MKISWKAVVSSIHGGAIACIALAASNAAASMIVYEFSGDCQDCAEFASGNPQQPTDEVLLNVVVAGDPSLGAGVDLSFPVFATLTLQNYNPGEALLSENFYGFSYRGSNLVNDFEVTLNQWLAGSSQILSGALPSAIDSSPTPAQLIMNLESSQPLYSCSLVGEQVGLCSDTSHLAMSTSVNGAWSLGAPPDDFGSSGSWSLENASIPEPTSTLLLLAGLAAASVRRRA